MFKMFDFSFETRIKTSVSETIRKPLLVKA